MRVRIVFCVLMFWCLLGTLAGLVFSVQRVVCEQGDLRVVNVDTGLEYLGIQAAVDAVETLDGHVVRVYPGVYRERVVVNKSVSLVGEDRSSTVIEGSGGSAVQVQSGDVEVRDFTVRNSVFGIVVDHADGARIIGNVVSDCSYGIRLYCSRGARVVGNYVSGIQYFGIDLDCSGNSFLRDNQMVGTTYNFGVDGKTLSDFINDIDESNTVNGNPVRYLINQRGLMIDSSTFQDVGYLGVVNSTNIVVEDLDVMNNKQGVLYAFVTNSSIVGVNAFQNWYGIYVVHSRNVSVISCSANFDFDYGIKFSNSSHSSAIGNNVDRNIWAGIGLFWSPSSTLERNEANFNTFNFHIVYTNSSAISRNNASGLSPNKPGSYSIAVYYSHNNFIHHNIFSTPFLYVEDRNGSRFAPSNVWDDGHEGNCWLNYDGGDRDYDGIGDAEYDIAEGNVDGFPLMGSFRSFAVLFEGVLHGVEVISNSSVSRFEFNSTGASVRLVVGGLNGSRGFCRIAVPNVLVQSVGDGGLAFVIEALEPVLVRNWSDIDHHYWYFSYVHVASSEGDSGVWGFAVAFGVTALLVSAGLIAFVVFRRRRRHVESEASV